MYWVDGEKITECVLDRGDEDKRFGEDLSFFLRTPAFYAGAMVAVASVYLIFFGRCSGQ